MRHRSRRPTGSRRCRRRGGTGVLVLALAVVLPAAGCSNGLDPDDPLATAMDAAGDPAAVARLAEDAPAPQAALLRDGWVSDGEYEQAITADHACVAAAGYPPGALQWNDGELGFEVEVSYEHEADAEAADEAFLASTARCRDEHSALVATVWVAQS